MSVKSEFPKLATGIVCVGLLLSSVAMAQSGDAHPEPNRTDRMRRLMVEQNLSAAEARARIAAEPAAGKAGGVAETAFEAGRPEQAFAGCETVIAKAHPFRSPQERNDAAPAPVDALTGRQFASMSANQLESSLARTEIESCWFRLDGVWREDRTVALDTNFHPEGWGSMRPEFVHLAHGTYTTPMHLFILPSSDPESELRLTRAGYAGEPVVYTSRDGIGLKDLLQKRGMRKVYMAARPAPIEGLAQRMTVDVTQTGYLRIRVGATTFFRPAPGAVSKVSGSDPFMIGYTMENLRANRAGYDVTAQNPDRLLQNAMAEVFDFAADRGAVIDQRRIIPMGLKLIKEETQGTVFYTRNVSSEREYQQMSMSSFGNSTRIGISGDVRADRDKGGGASVSIEAGLGWGADNARSQFSSLRTSGSVAEETGYMRFKKLALVLDPPYVRLTDRFIDAVADARRSGRFDELIRKFGTHYPYAVTYGAAGRLTQRITAKALERRRAHGSSSSSTANASFIVGNTSAYRASEGQSGSSLKMSNEYGERLFDAVGGNGSWDQNGFSAGDAHYPILADLRPLSELLNPINFPGQPEIYIDLRRRFDAAIGQYIVAKAALSTVSLIPPASAAKPTPADDVPPRVRVTTANGTTESITYSYRPGAGNRGTTRVCLLNNTKGTRTLIHGVARINPLETRGSGTRSCANFPSTTTLRLTAKAAGRPATLSPSKGVSLAPYERGVLQLEWR